MNSLKLEYRDPAELRGHYHPALKLIPELPDESPEYLGMAAAMGRLGLCVPLRVDEQGRILDDHSRTLLRLALRWQLKQVPVTMIPDVNAPLFVISAIANHRHLSKSAIAYLAAPLMNEAFELAKAKQREKLNDSRSALSALRGPDGAQTVEDLAEEISISRHLLFDARKVHELFKDKKTYPFNVRGGEEDGAVRECTLKEWFEPRILRAFAGGEHEDSRPVGLGAVIAGAASVKEANRGKFDPKSASQLELFDSGMAAFTGRALKLPVDKMRASVSAWFAAHAEKFEPEQIEQLEELGETIKAQARKLKATKA
jgi:hypothetical protein